MSSSLVSLKTRLVEGGKSVEGQSPLVVWCFGERGGGSSSADTLSRTQTFEVQRRFGEGRESVKGDDRSGRSQTARTAENLEKVSAAE
ncbi:hypothetical protein TNCV_163461 [Trichonephila clavipes]|nr:hypothetical protein TNCV_163461 [Trichonephila clavipes]